MSPSYATCSLFDFVMDAANNALANVTVTLTPAFSVADGSTAYVMSKQQSVLTDSTGKFTFTVPQSFTNDAEYIVQIPGLPAKRVNIPAGAGPFQVSQNLAADSG
jgi:hypothetical protein